MEKYRDEAQIDLYSNHKIIKIDLLLNQIDLIFDLDSNQSVWKSC
ncbi:hypothetical protein SAMN05421761_102168 [Belliella pelovolcani]|uniref:Uncharacterized protein n=1 Tax=Belliella pelovolcani TaxID=529505 RepID=A0A1N7KL26_9BACT|nr:hypothetical protein SAMN05421761_102168 [Belliella pelovolcani]